MKTTSRTTGRLGLLAIPMLTAALALALSACGSSSPGGSAPSRGSGAVSGNSARSSSAPSANTAQSDASSTQFCATWQEFKTSMSVMKAILDQVPSQGLATPASELLPTLRAIGGAFNSLDQVAPAAVSGEMTALTSYWSQVVAAFQSGGTVGQAEAHLKADPPANAATVKAGAQQLLTYLSGTCHISTGS